MIKLLHCLLPSAAAMCLKWQWEREAEPWSSVRESQKGVKQNSNKKWNRGWYWWRRDNEIFHKFHIQLSSSMLCLIKFSLIPLVCTFRISCVCSGGTAEDDIQVSIMFQYIYAGTFNELPSVESISHFKVNLFALRNGWRNKKMWFLRVQKKEFQEIRWFQ